MATCRPAIPCGWFQYGCAFRAPCQAFAGGRQFAALAASAPVRIVDGATGNYETVTPSSVVVSATGCTATLAPANTHPVPYRIVSGSAGLQEAINATKLSGTFKAGGSSAIIANAIGSTNLALVGSDACAVRLVRWNGTNYVTNSTNTGGAKPTAAAGAAAGTSPTISDTGNGNSLSVALATGTATTTGTLFTATWTASQFGTGVAPNCTVTSVGNNSPVAFTYAASTTPVLQTAPYYPCVVLHQDEHLMVPFKSVKQGLRYIGQ